MNPSHGDPACQKVDKGSGSIRVVRVAAILSPTASEVDAGSSALWPGGRHAIKSDAWVLFGQRVVDSKR